MSTTLNRRALVRGAAWAAPIVAATVAVPVYAASCPLGIDEGQLDAPDIYEDSDGTVVGMFLPITYDFSGVSGFTTFIASSPHPFLEEGLPQEATLSTDGLTLTYPINGVDDLYLEVFVLVPNEAVMIENYVLTVSHTFDNCCSGSTSNADWAVEGSFRE